MEDENGDRTQDHPLIKFILEPNKHQNFKEFSKEFVRNLFASGYEYLLPFSENPAYTRRLDRLDSDSRPELLALNTDFIEYMGTYWFGLVDKRNEFCYNKNGIEIKLKYEDVIPFWDKVQHPDNLRIGVSRLMSLEDEVTNVMLANRAKTNKIKQSGKFLVTPVESKDGTFGDKLDQPVSILNPDFKQRDKLEQDLENTGFSHGKSITVTKRELKAINLMETIQNYSYDKEVAADIRTIKNNYGIPRELQNLGNDQSKYENRKEAYLELFTLHILPLATNFTESIQNYYAPDDKLKFVLDYSHHPAFQVVENEKQNRMDIQVEYLMELYDKEVIDKKILMEKLEAYGIL